MTQPFLLPSPSPRIPVKDGNPSALALFRRHYSRKSQPRKLAQFVGPGEKLVFLAIGGDAVFAWRKFVSDAGEPGVNCSVFRNESAQQASTLIQEAMTLAWDRWPGERLYTYVNSRKIRRTRQPGRCFLLAGWRYVRGEDGKPKLTKERGYHILECLPEWAPEIHRALHRAQPHGPGAGFTGVPASKQNQILAEEMA